MSPKALDLEAPAAEPRFCDGDNTSQDSMVSRVIDTRLCSVSEEGVDKEREVIVDNSDQEMIQGVGMCGTSPVLDVEHALSPYSSPDNRTDLPHLEDVHCVSETSVPSKDLPEVASTLRSRVSDTEDELKTERNEEFSGSSIEPVNPTERDIQHDAYIFPGSEQTVRHQLILEMVTHIVSKVQLLPAIWKTLKPMMAKFADFSSAVTIEKQSAQGNFAMPLSQGCGKGVMLDGCRERLEWDFLDQ
ncbi:hypothetical protein PR048_033597 [Dryococelus australis]|uniref:Uncharacterized protein n=1 Tax=Dryococelus australis TaxID=614101 RepID=A0ABQ9G1M1_9NEOP|nr:hypothetical protein PR048_033597 [Dryococelus australis]